MSEIEPPRESELDPLRAKVSLLELAWTFNHIALASFGGGLSAWSREVLVVEKQWMGEAEFLSAMTMFRLNAKHLDLQFEDGSEWDEALQEFKRDG